MMAAIKMAVLTQLNIIDLLETIAQQAS